MTSDNNASDGLNLDIKKPDNMGRMNDPDGSAFIEGACGDSMEMYLVISDGMITESRYFTDGCSSSHFCGAAAAGLVKGKFIRDALRLSPADIIDTWGEQTDQKIHCAILAVSTLHKAIADYLIRTRNS